MLHRLCGPPSIPLSFSLATVPPRRGTYCVSSGTEMITTPTPSTHRLRRGLPGYLIPFAPHALAPQRQCPARRPPSPPTFFRISTHFTAPPGIPPPPPALKPTSLRRPSPVKPRAFTSHLARRLRALYAQSFRTTLAPSVYRGCWHGVSRGFLRRYRHTGWLFTTRLFVPADRALHPERRPHSRGVAASGSRPLRKIPTAASRRSLGRVSVPVWLIILSDQLPIAALVGHYPTN